MFRGRGGAVVTAMKPAGGRRLIGVLAVGLLVASGCGGGEDSSAEGFRVATIARSMEEAGTARFAGTATFHSSENDSSWTLEGAVDFANDRSSSEIWKDGAKGDEAVTRSISIDGVGYTADATDRREGIGPATHDKPWVRSEPGPTAAPLELTGLGDISHVFDLLERSGWNGEQVGDEQVRGESTVHYRYTLSDASRDAPRQVQAMDLGYPEEQSIDLWADSQWRLRRLTQTVTGEDSRFVVGAELFDFGEPVVIEAPPSDQVVADDSFETTGDWKLVTRGRDGDDTWRVFRVPLRNGECFAHDTTPETKTGDLGLEIVGVFQISAHTATAMDSRAFTRSWMRPWPSRCRAAVRCSTARSAKRCEA